MVRTRVPLLLALATPWLAACGPTWINVNSPDSDPTWDEQQCESVFADDARDGTPAADLQAACMYTAGYISEEDLVNGAAIDGGFWFSYVPYAIGGEGDVGYVRGRDEFTAGGGYVAGLDAGAEDDFGFVRLRYKRYLTFLPFEVYVAPNVTYLFDGYLGGYGEVGLDMFVETFFGIGIVAFGGGAFDLESGDAVPLAGLNMRLLLRILAL